MYKGKNGSRKIKRRGGRGKNFSNKEEDHDKRKSKERAYDRIIGTVLRASLVSYNSSSNLINIKLTVIKRKVQIHPSAINYRVERRTEGGGRVFLLLLSFKIGRVQGFFRGLLQTGVLRKVISPWSP
jgi:hypothetical protein